MITEKEKKLFEEILKESPQLSIKTIEDGIKFLSIWNNKSQLYPHVYKDPK